MSVKKSNFANEKKLRNLLPNYSIDRTITEVVKLLTFICSVKNTFTSGFTKSALQTI